MKIKPAYTLAACILAFLAIALLGGCVKGPSYSVDYSVSDPYEISSGVIEMKVNATAMVRINNSGAGELRFRVDKAVLTGILEDGSSVVVEGRGDGGTVPPDGTYDMELAFEGVPVRYVLKDNPPRFHSIISHYDINVTTTGQQRIIFFWSPEKTSQTDMRVPMNDMPVGEYLRGVKDTFKVGGIGGT